jgi:hypothetical protein
MFRKKSSNAKVSVYKADLQYLNELTISGDDARRNIATLLLTVYSAALSGLFIFVSTTKLTLDHKERYLFLAAALTSGVIVLSSLLEKLFDYFAKVQVCKQHVENIRKGKTASQTGSFNPLTPRAFTVWVLRVTPWLQLTLIFLNAFSVIGYIFLKVPK